MQIEVIFDLKLLIMFVNSFIHSLHMKYHYTVQTVYILFYIQYEWQSTLQ